MANVLLSEIRITVLLIMVQSPKELLLFENCKNFLDFFAYIMLERTTQARGIEKIDS